jgi:hypothetical protein
MSYARKGLNGSDVYVYRTGLPSSPCELICADCALLTVSHHTEEIEAGMLAHLAQHTAAGHHVPPAAIDRLTRESGEVHDLDSPDEMRGDYLRDLAKD